MKSIHDLLKEHPTFGNFHDTLLDVMAGCGQNVHFDPGTTIVREGDPAGSFYLLRSGRVGIEISVPHRGGVVIETLGAGEILGVSWPFPPYRWTFDGKAYEHTSAIAMDAQCLRTKCDEDHELGYQVFSRFAELMRDRLYAMRLQLLDLYSAHAG